MKKTIAEHAADILRETDNPAVMWGDCGLLDMIFFRAGMKDKPHNGTLLRGGDRMTCLHPSERHKRVLDALERSSLFEKKVVYIRTGLCGNQLGRLFTLKGNSP